VNKQTPTISAGRRQQEIRLIDRIVRLQKEERKTSAVPASAAQHGRAPGTPWMPRRTIRESKSHARPAPTTARRPRDVLPKLRISPIFSSIFRVRDRAKNILGNLRIAATKHSRHNFRAWPCPGKRQP
jgi:hypothetical protein